MSIFEKTTLNHMVAKNRLVRSATWVALASPDGRLNDEIYEIYRELAAGGVGVIISELMDVSPYDWALHGNMRLCSDLLIPDYRKLTDIVHEHDCPILAQLNINEYYRMEHRLVHVPIEEMTEADIKDLIDLFAAAAKRAEAASFDGVQLHLAYDWLLGRWLSPQYNHRTDAYGGSAENRFRIVKDIISAIRDAAPSLHICAKFTFLLKPDGSYDEATGIEIGKLLLHSGLDSLEILGEHSERERGTKREACYLDFAQAVLEGEDDVIPVILTGNNHDIEHMEKLLAETGIPYYGMSRPLICEPHLPNRWASGTRDKAKCLSCNGCYDTPGKRCVFNLK